METTPCPYELISIDTRGPCMDIRSCFRFSSWCRNLNSDHLTSTPNQASPSWSAFRIAPPMEAGTLQGLPPLPPSVRNHSPELAAHLLEGTAHACYCSEQRNNLTGSLLITATVKTTCNLSILGVGNKWITSSRPAWTVSEILS